MEFRLIQKFFNKTKLNSSLLDICFIVKILTGAGILTFISLSVNACFSQEGHYLGYVEARYTYMSSLFPGKLIELNVGRGSIVKENQVLFRLEQQPELSNVQAAFANVEEFLSKVTDLQKGQRPSELQSVVADIQSAQAQLDFAEKTLNRNKTLVSKNSLAQSELDHSIQDVAVVKATINKLENNLITAKIGSRTDVIAQAKAQLNAAKATLKRTQWNLRQKTVLAPTDAWVYDTYYRIGEEVPATHPILSLLKSSDIKVLFFVPESVLAKLYLGQQIEVSCDQCNHDIKASISFISAIAEFTPPVIYSQSTRNKLIYQVEAKLNKQATMLLHPGQPLDITVKFNETHRDRNLTQ